MIRVAILTTVLGRPKTTSAHIEWITTFKQRCLDIGIQIKPLYVLSPGDRYINNFLAAIQGGPCSHIINKSTRLSDKTQAGLDALKLQTSFDWLMHLDSDEFLSFELMKRWKQEFEDGNKWFGSRSCYFWSNGGYWEFKGYDDHPVKNGGTCVARAILEHADWELWPFSKSTGLNVMERRRIEKLGYNITPIDTQDIYGVLEVKGGNSIHGLEWFEKRDLLRELSLEEAQELMEHHKDVMFF